MGRKGENIYKRKDKRWEGRYIVSYNAEGKAVYKSIYGKTYTEVRLKMRNQSKPDKMKHINVSLADWTEDYLKSQADRLKTSTSAIYERYLRRYIKPFFGNMLLRKINKEILQSFINSLSELSPSTVKGVFSFLREALKKANKDEYITPLWLDIDLPKIKRNNRI